MKHILLGGLIALLLTGCSKLNRENYDKLKMGITYAEASAILGKAERCDDASHYIFAFWQAEFMAYGDSYRRCDLHKNLCFFIA